MGALISVINDFFCWFGSVLDNPGGFLNAIANVLITVSLAILPSTPQSLKVSSLLASIAQDNALAAWFIATVLSALSPALLIHYTIKIWKLLPFT